MSVDEDIQSGDVTADMAVVERSAWAKPMQSWALVPLGSFAVWLIGVAYMAPIAERADNQTSDAGYGVGFYIVVIGALTLVPYGVGGAIVGGLLRAAFGRPAYAVAYVMMALGVGFVLVGMTIDAA